MGDNARLTELVSAAYDSAGSSEKQFEKLEDSLDFKLKTLKDTWDEFVLSITNSDLVKAVIDIANGILSAVNKLTDLPGILSGVAKSLVVVGTFIGGKKLASNLVDKAASNLGKNIGEGIAKGVTGTKGEVENAVGDVISNAVGGKGKDFSRINEVLANSLPQGTKEIKFDLDAIFPKNVGKRADEVVQALQKVKNEQEIFQRLQERYDAVDAYTDKIELRANKTKDSTDIQRSEIANVERKKALNQLSDQAVVRFQAETAALKELSAAYELTEKQSRQVIDAVLAGENADTAAVLAITNKTRAEVLDSLAQKDVTDATEDQIIAEAILTSNVDEATAAKLRQIAANKQLTIEGKAQNLALKLQGLTAENVKNKIVSVFNSIKNVGKAALQSTGKVIGGVVDAIDEVVSSLPVIGKVGIAIAAVSAAVAAGVAIYKEYFSTAAQVAQASERVEQAKENADAAKQSYDSLLSSINEYRDAQSAFDGLIEGTQAWNEALLESNALVLQLLNNYPQLGGYVTSDNGRLEVTEEGIEKVVDAAMQSVTNSQIVEAIDEIALNNANKANLRSNFGGEGSTLGLNISSAMWDQIEALTAEELAAIYNDSQTTVSDIFKNIAEVLHYSSDNYQELAGLLIDYQEQLQSYDLSIEGQSELLEGYIAQGINKNNKYVKNIASAFVKQASNEITNSAIKEGRGNIKSAFGWFTDGQMRVPILKTGETRDYIEYFNERYKNEDWFQEIDYDEYSKDAERIKAIYSTITGIAIEELDKDWKVYADEIASFDIGQNIVDDVEEFYNSFNALGEDQQRVVASIIDKNQDLLKEVDVTGEKGAKTLNTLSDDIVNSLGQFYFGPDAIKGLDANAIKEKLAEYTDEINTFLSGAYNAFQNIIPKSLEKIDTTELKNSIKDFTLDVQKKIYEGLSTFVKMEPGDIDQITQEITNLLPKVFSSAEEADISSFADAWSQIDPNDYNSYLNFVNAIKDLDLGDSITQIESFADQLFNMTDKAQGMGETLDEIWSSMDDGARSELVKLARSSGITADKVNELAQENSQLSEFLEETGLSAEYVANCFEEMGDKGTSAMELITADGLKLNDTLRPMADYINAANASYSQYQSALEGSDYGDQFNNYVQAFTNLGEYIEKGEFGKDFRRTAEYLFGADIAADSVDIITKAFNNLKGMFAEGDYGSTFLDRLYSIRTALAAGPGDSSITLDSNGDYIWELDPADFDIINEKLGTTTDMLTALSSALAMQSEEFREYDIEALQSMLKNLDMAVSGVNDQTIIGKQSLQKELQMQGFEGWEISQMISDFNELEGVHIIDLEVKGKDDLTVLMAQLKELTGTDFLNKKGELVLGNANDLFSNGGFLDLLSDMEMSGDEIEDYLTQLDDLGISFIDSSGNAIELEAAIKAITEAQKEGAVLAEEYASKTQESIAKGNQAVNRLLDYTSTELTGKLSDLKIDEDTFDFSTADLDSITKQLDIAQQLLEKFTEEDGKIDIEAEGADEALQIIEVLIARKQELGKPEIMNVDTSKISDSEDTLRGTIETLQQMQSALDEYQRQLANPVKYDDSDLDKTKTKIQEISTDITNLPDNTLIELGITDPKDFKDEIRKQLEGVTGTADIKASDESIDAIRKQLSGIKDTQIEALVDKDAYKKSIPQNEEASVKLKINKQQFQGDIQAAASGRKYTVPITGVLSVSSSSSSGNKGAKEPAGDEGAVGVQGTAYAQGRWGLNGSGTALGGELGPEILVRDGHYYVIGEDSAEFFDYQKDDIIFNAEQTRQILKNGKIKNGIKRGVSYANGTVSGPAFIGGRTKRRTSGTTSTSTSTKSSTSSKSSSSSQSSSSNNSSQEVSEEVYVPDLDKYYNLLQKIERTQERITVLEDEAEVILDQEVVDLDALHANQEKRLTAYKQELAYQQQLEAGRKQEIKDLEARNAQYLDYARYNEQTMSVEVDWDKVNSITDKDFGEGFEEYLSELEDYAGDIIDAQEKARDIQQDINDLVKEVIIEIDEFYNKQQDINVFDDTIEKAKKKYEDVLEDPNSSYEDIVKARKNLKTDYLWQAVQYAQGRDAVQDKMAALEAEHPEFLDIAKFDPEKGSIVYNPEKYGMKMNPEDEEVWNDWITRYQDLEGEYQGFDEGEKSILEEMAELSEETSINIDKYYNTLQGVDKLERDITNLKEEQEDILDDENVDLDALAQNSEAQVQAYRNENSLYEELIQGSKGDIKDLLERFPNFADIVTYNEKDNTITVDQEKAKAVMNSDDADLFNEFLDSITDKSEDIDGYTDKIADNNKEIEELTKKISLNIDKSFNELQDIDKSNRNIDKLKDQQEDISSQDNVDLDALRNNINAQIEEYQGQNSLYSQINAQALQDIIEKESQYGKFAEIAYYDEEQGKVVVDEEKRNTMLTEDEAQLFDDYLNYILDKSEDINDYTDKIADNNKAIQELTKQVGINTDKYFNTLQKIEKITRDIAREEDARRKILSEEIPDLDEVRASQERQKKLLGQQRDENKKDRDQAEQDLSDLEANNPDFAKYYHLDRDTGMLVEEDTSGETWSAEEQEEYEEYRDKYEEYAKKWQEADQNIYDIDQQIAELTEDGITNLDKSYNLLEQIEDVSNKRELAERRYNRALEDGSATIEELVQMRKEDYELTLQQFELQQQISAEREKQYQDTLLEGRLKGYGDYVTLSPDGYLQIDWSKIDESNQELIDAIEEWISEVNSAQDNVQSSKTAEEDFKDSLLEYKQSAEDSRNFLYDTVYQMIVALDKAYIEDKADLVDTLNESNQNMVGAIRDTLAQLRQERSNQRTEEDLGEKQRRLLYLQMDTQGATDLEALNLRKELEEQQESYTDQLIDQKINELEEQNDEAASQRQMLIDIMNQQLDESIRSGRKMAETRHFVDDFLSGKNTEVFWKDVASYFPSSQQLGDTWSGFFYGIDENGDPFNSFNEGTGNGFINDWTDWVEQKLKSLGITEEEGTPLGDMLIALNAIANKEFPSPGDYSLQLDEIKGALANIYTYMDEYNKHGDFLGDNGDNPDENSGGNSGGEGGGKTEGEPGGMNLSDLWNLFGFLETMHDVIGAFGDLSDFFPPEGSTQPSIEGFDEFIGNASDLYGFISDFLGSFPSTGSTQPPAQKPSTQQPSKEQPQKEETPKKENPPEEKSPVTVKALPTVENLIDFDKVKITGEKNAGIYRNGKIYLQDENGIYTRAYDPWDIYKGETGYYIDKGKTATKDNLYTAADARQVLRWSAKLDTDVPKLGTTKFDFYDINGDRQITAGDASNILKRSANLKGRNTEDFNAATWVLGVLQGYPSEYTDVIFSEWTQDKTLAQAIGKVNDDHPEWNLSDIFLGTDQWKKFQNIMGFFGEKRYASGGLADFTGPAWLDGTKSKPEVVLSQQDSLNFIALRDILSDIMSKNIASISNNNSQNNGDIYIDIDLQVDKLTSDYDVEDVANKVMSIIDDKARYRNINVINRIR